MSSLLDLLDVHADLRERFALHRDYIVGLKFARALEALEAFEARLRSHMEAEERLVLPLYEARVGHVPGGDPQFFYLEHKNILKNLESAKEGLRNVARDACAGRRAAHVLIQQESLLFQLLEHHDLREKNILYPLLDSKLTPEERVKLVRDCGSAAEGLSGHS